MIKRLINFRFRNVIKMTEVGTFCDIFWIFRRYKEVIVDEIDKNDNYKIKKGTKLSKK